MVKNIILYFLEGNLICNFVKLWRPLIVILMVFGSSLGTYAPSLGYRILQNFRKKVAEKSIAKLQYIKNTNRNEDN